MSLVSVSKDKLSSIRERSGNMPDLNGWKQVGYYGSCFIYASGDIRRLIDPAAGRITFQFRMPTAKKV
jgi:hypothetical protein